MQLHVHTRMYGTENTTVNVRITYCYGGELGAGLSQRSEPPSFYSSYLKEWGLSCWDPLPPRPCLLFGVSPLPCRASFLVCGSALLCARSGSPVALPSSKFCTTEFTTNTFAFSLTTSFPTSSACHTSSERTSPRSSPIDPVPGADTRSSYQTALARRPLQTAALTSAVIPLARYAFVPP
jgi:hypothetical protein